MHAATDAQNKNTKTIFVLEIFFSGTLFSWADAFFSFFGFLGFGAFFGFFSFFSFFLAAFFFLSFLAAFFLSSALSSARSSAFSADKLPNSPPSSALSESSSSSSSRDSRNLAITPFFFTFSSPVSPCSDSLFLFFFPAFLSFFFLFSFLSETPSSLSVGIIS